MKSQLDTIKEGKAEDNITSDITAKLNSIHLAHLGCLTTVVSLEKQFTFSGSGQVFHHKMKCFILFP